VGVNSMDVGKVGVGLLVTLPDTHPESIAAMRR